VVVASVDSCAGSLYIQENLCARPMVAACVTACLSQVGDISYSSLAAPIMVV
jgi:hypothetical protein